MKLFLLAVLCASALASEEQKREKRGFLTGEHSLPDIGYSAPSYSYSAPSYSYSAPSYSYSAPSYSYAAPSYSYAAPSYSYAAPSYGYDNAYSHGYSAPLLSSSYAAPRYSSVYSAPVLSSYKVVSAPRVISKVASSYLPSSSYASGWW